MTTPEHSREELIEYLLGSLSEGESERFDALSVSSKEFAEELSAVEADLVDAYVQGELPGERRTRFETHYLASPLRREKIEFSRAFMAYGKEATERVVVAVKPERSSAGFLS